MEFSPVKILTRDNYHSMKVASVSSETFPFGLEPTRLEAIAPTWLANRTPRGRYNFFRDRSYRGQQ